MPPSGADPGEHEESAEVPAGGAAEVTQGAQQLRQYCRQEETLHTTGVAESPCLVLFCYTFCLQHINRKFKTRLKTVQIKFYFIFV